jgi:hypothetical protein
MLELQGLEHTWPFVKFEQCVVSGLVAQDSRAQLRQARGRGRVNLRAVPVSAFDWSSSEEEDEEDEEGWETPKGKGRVPDEEVVDHEEELRDQEGPAGEEEGDEEEEEAQPPRWKVKGKAVADPEEGLLDLYQSRGEDDIYLDEKELFDLSNAELGTAKLAQAPSRPVTVIHIPSRRHKQKEAPDAPLLRSWAREIEPVSVKPVRLGRWDILALERRAEESEEYSQPVMEERIRRMTTILQELVRHLRDWPEDRDEEENRPETVCEEDEDEFF